MKPSDVFKSRSKPQIITTTRKEGETEQSLEWKVKPLSPRLLVQNYKYFAALEKLDNKDNKELTEEEQTNTLEKLAPLIDVVLPFCCVDPRVVIEGETSERHINIDDLDVETLMQLFTKIFEISGMSKDAAENRINLEQPPSQNQLPNSV